MPTYVAFLRAVNVGKRQVKMDRLRKHLLDNGFSDVETHIASGNLKVTTASRSATKVAATLHDTISEEFGFDVPVVVRTPAQLRAAATEVDALSSPLSTGARVYVTFLDGVPDAAGATTLDEWDVPGERARVHGDHLVLWLDTPSHSAKLTNTVIEKRTKRVATTRDIKVVRALAVKWGA
ncbi:MAG: DUF1697 domain-containing protein [Lapillicoccus sp.]